MLTALGTELSIAPADIDESAFTAPTPRELVCLLAREKALAASKELGAVPDPIVAADTVVDLDGRVLGKPETPEAAAEMLRALSGKAHTVHTGVAVYLRGKVLSDTVSTAVFFRKLSEEEIARYVATGEPMDKAGAYGIQGIGGLLVQGIEGDYHAVVGLPICRLHEMLVQIGTKGLLA